MLMWRDLCGLRKIRFNASVYQGRITAYGMLGVVLIGLLRTYSEGQQRCQVGWLANTRLLVIRHWPWSGVLFPLKKVGIDCDNVSTLQLYRCLLPPDDTL